MKLLIEPHYLGCLEYYCLVKSTDEVLLEVFAPFTKQSYRNRAYFLGSNKIQQLVVPLSYKNGDLLKEVRIDYNQRWVKDHWGALYSGYGKAPFFDYFADEFKAIWDSKEEFLVDLNIKMLSLCLKLIGHKQVIKLTESYKEVSNSDCLDMRNTIHPKIDFSGRNIYQPNSYSQLFGDSFVPNLSIVDLIMCEGPQAGKILAESYRGKM